MTEENKKTVDYIPPPYDPEEDVEQNTVTDSIPLEKKFRIKRIIFIANDKLVDKVSIYGF